FWAGDPGWRDQQLPDGRVIWTAPDGRTHVTTPGSRLLFPELCQPTATVSPVDVPTRPAHTTGLRMPRRRTTRAQDRTRRIHDERELNKALIAAEAEQKVAAAAEAKAAAEQARAAAQAAEPPPPF
ncbi:MAG: HNH endonuclease signature motif containing protein, partial [Mycobacterium sp.]